jgi:hypothetical protein
MTDKKTLTDGNHIIELHHLRGSGHNAGLIMAYLPKQKILYQGDGYNPPPQANAPVLMPYSPYQINLLETIERLKLDVDWMIATHYPTDGRRVTVAELRRMVGRGN